ncbi:MAG TPA: FmdB family zinc ribbon protein [Candidatus Rubrimentiphilum sp.]|nr:FmdB family zinc ribbon protein [Candidatus Rubrimentiphilum sp.]
MPLYDYKCSSCQKVTEIRHGFGEDVTSPCPQCGGKLARVFNPAPIVFKGSGFYVTDSRGKSQSAPAKDTPAKDASAKDTPAKDTPAASTPAKDPAA